MTKIKARESQNVEYKSSWHDKYLEWICGFANAQGAVMYFGVNNDHEVNIADINTITDVILSHIYHPRCDVNDDGEVNIADINMVIDIILAS